MEILITLILIGLVVMLFPYILAGILAATGIFVGIIALFVAGVKKMFS